MKKWAATFPAHAVTDTQIGTYADVLGDLSPEELNAACREATKSAEQFPKPAHIRAALKRLEVIPRTRPAYLDEPILSASERWTEETREASDRLRAQLGLPPAEPLAASRPANDGKEPSEGTLSRKTQ
jgi:hypothetical protein